MGKALPVVFLFPSVVLPLVNLVTVPAMTSAGRRNNEILYALNELLVVKKCSTFISHSA